MRADAVPEIIAAAGDAAVRAYRGFLDDSSWSPSTRKNYRHSIVRFVQWAEARGFALQAITSADAAAYAAELATCVSQQSMYTQLTGVRGLFRHLEGTGAIPADPFEKPGVDSQEDNGESTADYATHPEPGPVGFPLLDLLTMLGHMEEQTLRRIFEEEAIALSLLKQVCWRDGRECPHCGADAGWHDDETETVCSACAKPFGVTTGTMLEGSEIPVRLWLVVIHHIYLAQPGLADDELRQRFGLDLPAVLRLSRRIGEAMVQEGLPIGHALRQALEVRNRELGQDQVLREIKNYMVLEATRDRLMHARRDGTHLDDLPPGVTLDEALARIEARIAQHDRYVYYRKDGYLVSRLATPDELAAAAAQPVPAGKEPLGTGEVCDAR